MTSSVFTDPSPQYRTATGDVCAGGSLQFFATGTLTAQDVYSDSALTTNIGSIVTLGSDGRATGSSGTITVYLDASKTYRAQLYDVNGAKQWDVDPYNPQAASGSTIPALVANAFLTTDGTQLLWELIRQLPDPNGANGKIPYVSGNAWGLTSLPAAGANGTNADVTLKGSGVVIGNGAGVNWGVQIGSDTAPASGAHTTSKAITFPTAFSAVPFAIAIPRKQAVGTGATGSAFNAVPATLFLSAAGFTAHFDTGTDSSQYGNIMSDFPFDWIALGPM